MRSRTAAIPSMALSYPLPGPTRPKLRMTGRVPRPSAASPHRAEGSGEPARRGGSPGCRWPRRNVGQDRGGRTRHHDDRIGSTADRFDDRSLACRWPVSTVCIGGGDRFPDSVQQLEHQRPVRSTEDAELVLERDDLHVRRIDQARAPPVLIGIVVADVGDDRRIRAVVPVVGAHQAKTGPSSPTERRRSAVKLAIPQRRGG